MADDLPIIHPEAEDDRGTLRLKVRLARDCLKIADAGMFEHALAALFELGMGRKMPTVEHPKGQAIDIAPRSRATALAAFTRSVTALVEKGTVINDNRTQILTAIDLVHQLDSGGAEE
jgi:hypothetical protein